MLRFITLLVNSSFAISEPGVGIILQQNTSVLLLQDSYTGTWGFSTFNSEKFNSNQLDIFGAIHQLREDTGYNARDFVIIGPPCRYGNTYYWYATLQTLNPPRLLNKHKYKNVKFMSRNEIPKLLYYPEYDVEMWMDDGMRYSCLKRYYT